MFPGDRETGNGGVLFHQRALMVLFLQVSMRGELSDLAAASSHIQCNYLGTYLEHSLIHGSVGETGYCISHVIPLISVNLSPQNVDSQYGR